MKLGVAFSVYSGLELLKPALQNVREFAAHTVVVYSIQSNEGHYAPAFMLPLLRSLESEGLIDELVEHRLDKFSIEPLRMQTIQRIKRQMGRTACLNVGCTHYMSRDCDEFYDKQQFRAALAIAEKHQLTICRLYDYVGSPRRRAVAPSILHLPFVQSTLCSLIPKDFGVLIDHERTCDASEFVVLRPDEVIMHHMTAVRYNKTELDRKFQGHSHFMRLGQQATQQYVDMIQCANTDPAYMDTNDQFGIEAYWAGEFKKWYEG